jgi:hypothetical protein
MPSGLLHSEFDNEVIPLHAKGHQRWKCPFKDGNGLKDVEPSDTNWNCSLMTFLNEQIVNILERTTELA